MKKLIFLLPLAVWAAQIDRDETITRDFRGVRKVVVDNVEGFIHVTASAGDDAHAGIRKRLTAESTEKAEEAGREVKLEVTQEGDTVRFYVDGPFRCRDGCVHNHGNRGYRVIYDFELRAPRDAALTLKTVNRGDIDVRDVAGDFDLSNINGGIALRETAGAGKAHTINGKVQVWFRANPRAACSFKTINGAIEAWFQPGLAADVFVKTFHGGAYTDFDAATLPQITPAAERRNGKFVYRSNRFSGVRVGKGGPELRFETLNGEIHLRSRGQ